MNSINKDYNRSETLGKVCRYDMGDSCSGANSSNIALK